MRWVGKLKALYIRHELLVKEIIGRGYNHKSDLSVHQATGNKKQDVLINTPNEQVDILKQKNCLCFNSLDKKD